MAPKRKGGARKAAPAANKLPTQDAEKQEVPAPAEEVVVSATEEEDKAEDEPSPKKTKVEEEKKKRGRRPKAASKAFASAKKTADENGKKSAEDNGKEDEKGAAEDKVEGSDDAGKIIIIEASKECNCFKTRAAKVQTGLTKAVPGIEVLINPDKPRKGCFEVRSKEGNIYLSLLGMPRPFTKLKNYDIDKAIEDIVAKVK